MTVQINNSNCTVWNERQANLNKQSSFMNIHKLCIDSDGRRVLNSWEHKRVDVWQISVILNLVLVCLRGRKALGD